MRTPQLIIPFKPDKTINVARYRELWRPAIPIEEMGALPKIEESAEHLDTSDANIKRYADRKLLNAIGVREPFDDSTIYLLRQKPSKVENEYKIQLIVRTKYMLPDISEFDEYTKRAENNLDTLLQICTQASEQTPSDCNFYTFEIDNIDIPLTQYPLATTDIYREIALTLRAKYY